MNGTFAGSSTPPIAGSDLGQLILLGNDIALQWYAATHNQGVPPPQLIPGTRIPTIVITDTTRWLIIGGVVVAAVFLMRR